MNEAVAKVIKRLRTSHKISQEKLADAINSHQVYISEIESGKKLPSLIVLNNMAIFFGLTLTELINQIEQELDIKNQTSRITNIDQM